MRRDSSETKRKILTVCVRLFLEQGYKNTSVSQIVDEADVARGSYLNLFPTKDRVLLDLTETMFGGQKIFRHEIRMTIFKGGNFMTDKTFMRADEVAEELDVSKAYAYKIIRQLNDELSTKGFITVAGRVSRQYFSERIYGAERRDD